MVQDMFTHDFKFDMANTTLKGEVEFNTDQEVSMEIKQAGIPLKTDTMQVVLDIFELLKELIENGETINLIKIEKKD